MREIKFRAWDKETDTMIYSDERDGELYDYHFLVSEKGVTAISIEDYDDKFGYPQSKSAELDNIMQYTGLKDKKSKEIYEGDIGKWYIARGNDFILFEVVWMVEEACFMGRYKDEHGNPRFISLINSDKGTKIIGNIYENKELLEVE